jgi:hypothetical protein
LGGQKGEGSIVNFKQLKLFLPLRKNVTKVQREKKQNLKNSLKAVGFFFSGSQEIY